MRDFTSLTGSLELATALRPLTQAAAAKVVWHCPLRTAPGDRVLSDAQWAEVARDVVDRTGIARRGDDGGCRWVAVRHDDVSIHLVAVLARQDGQAVRIGNDYRRLREACRDAERRLGLTGTAPADRTAATHVGRAEVEKTRRTRGPAALPDRVWLRQQVQLTATWARDPTEFLDRLRKMGIAVRERHDADGALTGYAVARPPTAGSNAAGPATASGTGSGAGSGTGSEAGPLVFYGGGKLAPDLTLPHLLARWPAADSADAAAPPSSAAARRRGDSPDLKDLEDLKQQTQRALGRAADLLRQHSQAAQPAGQRQGQPDPRGDRAAADLTAASAELLRALAWQVEGRDAGPVRRAAQQYGRAGRTPGGHRPAQTPGGARLRELASLLLQTSRGQGVQGGWGDVLLQALALAATVAELRRTQQHAAQHAAALAAVGGLLQVWLTLLELDQAASAA